MCILGRSCHAIILNFLLKLKCQNILNRAIGTKNARNLQINTGIIFLYCLQYIIGCSEIHCVIIMYLIIPSTLSARVCLVFDMHALRIPCNKYIILDEDNKLWGFLLWFGQWNFFSEPCTNCKLLKFLFSELSDSGTYECNVVLSQNSTYKQKLFETIELLGKCIS